MPASMVIDASVVVDGLIDQTSAGDRARELMGQPGIYVPDLLYSEVSSALRRQEVRLSVLWTRVRDASSCAVGSGASVSADSPGRWHEVSLYDAAYVALATLGVPLATKDRKHRYCEVVIPGVNGEPSFLGRLNQFLGRRRLRETECECSRWSASRVRNVAGATSPARSMMWRSIGVNQRCAMTWPATTCASGE